MFTPNTCFGSCVGDNRPYNDVLTLPVRPPDTTLIPPAINVGVGVDVETTGRGTEVWKIGVETGFIKLGVSDLVSDLRDMPLAHLGVSIIRVFRVLWDY